MSRLSTTIGQPGLRDPSMVMRLERMGAFHQTRLSFMRAILRRVKSEQWQFERKAWEVDEQGVGHAVYCLTGPKRSYTLVAFAHDLAPEQRSDRVIATAWDATFTLLDGEASANDIERLRTEVPRQEAGRVSSKELVLSRANRSVRLFDSVAKQLSRGQQPDITEIEAVGYLMRTTAVYGNGKFGLCDRNVTSQRAEANGPFALELTAVWLIRQFTVDIVEHMAKVAGPNTAVRLAPELRRRIGVGNSTGLGMAPFLANHPVLLHQWINAREAALAAARAVQSIDASQCHQFLLWLQRAAKGVDEWQTVDPRQADRVQQLSKDIEQLEEHCKVQPPENWNQLYVFAEAHLSIEAQELVVSLLIEQMGDAVDELTQTMAADETPYFDIDGSVTVAATLSLVEKNCAWALDVDFQSTAANARFWYVSEEKLEPRIGERYKEGGAELEQPLSFAREVSRLQATLKGFDGKETLSEFLRVHPEHRHTVRRVQNLASLPYSEIRDNLIDAAMVPVDMLRCKLSFFGAVKFDPRSDRWTRITMYQDAPFPDEFASMSVDDWSYPSVS